MFLSMSCRRLRAILLLKAAYFAFLSAFFNFTNFLLCLLTFALVDLTAFLRDLTLLAILDSFFRKLKKNDVLK